MRAEPSQMELMPLQKRLWIRKAPDTESAIAFISDFPASWIVRNQSDVFISYSIKRILWEQPEQTRTKDTNIFKRLIATVKLLPRAVAIYILTSSYEYQSFIILTFQTSGLAFTDYKKSW